MGDRSGSREPKLSSLKKSKKNPGAPAGRVKKVAKAIPTSTQTLPPASTSQPAEAGSTQIQEPEVVETLDTPKVSFCKEKWIKFSETKKFGSQEQMQNTYDNFMASCVGQM